MCYKPKRERAKRVRTKREALRREARSAECFHLPKGGMVMLADDYHLPKRKNSLKEENGGVRPIGPKPSERSEQVARRVAPSLRPEGPKRERAKRVRTRREAPRREARSAKCFYLP